MKPLVFVDANVLIYSEDMGDPAKQAVAKRWLELLWQQRTGRVSTQTLNEFYLHATRKISPPMPGGDARAEVRRYCLWAPWHIDQATVESAWAIESRHGLNYWDCLMVASAQHMGCTVLLSEDLAHGQHYGSVQVINPFIADISILETP
jgi:predicted nucleic acid-binding protein